jgi:PAS domain S-box-containing protein
VIVVHDSLQILYLNRKGLESIGAESQDEVVGRSLWDFVSREYHAVLQERVAVLLAGGRGVPPFELPLVLADGTEIWGEVSSAPIRYDGISAVQTVVRDVTRRRETEAELTASETRYRSLFNGVPVGLYRSTLDGRILDANDALVQLLGYEDRGQLMRVGTSALYIDPAERERWVRRALAAPESSESEVRLQRRDGSELLVRLHSRVKYGPTGEVEAFEGSVEDVTRTRRAEARYRLLFETMAQGVIYQDASGRVLSANPAAERILGVSARALIDGSASLHDGRFLHTDGTRFPVSQLPAAVALREGRSIRALLGFRRRPDDVLRWIEIESIPLYHPGADRPYQVFCTLADVTERREKEEALRLSEQRLDRAMAGSGLGLWDWNVTTGEIYVDDRWYAMLGYRPGELPLDMEAWTELVHPEDRERVQGELQRHLEGGTAAYETELRLRTAAGGWHWILDRGQVVERAADGTPLRAAGTHTDIEARKAAEVARHRSEERLESIFRAAPLGITLSRVSDGTFLEVNDTFAEMLGFTREEMLGRTSMELGIWADVNDRARMAEELESAGSLRGFSVRFKTREGRTRQLQLFMERITVEDEPCALVLHQDVTDSRQLEEQLRQSQKMEAVGRLAGGIAHDFNNLLTVMTGHVQFLLDALPESDDRRADASAIAESAERAERLTRQLLAFSRQQMMAPQVVDLRHMVSRFEPLLTRLIGEDVLLDVRSVGDPCPVRVDLSQLEQVVLNLAVNARDAMPSGGRLSIETSQVEVVGGRAPGVGEAVRDGRYACLRVKDSGIGMDALTRERVFEPFYTTKPAGKGTGLGLSTVYGIVNQSDGAIGVESQPGEGACFTLYLPLVKQESSVQMQGRAEGSAHGAAGGTETILLVEDEDAVRALARRVLERGGYTVHAAPDGATALKLAEELGSVDLLLTDVVMPGMGGRELADRLRERCPDLEVVFMSGYTSDEVIRRAEHRGGGFLQKPFTPGQLAAVAREVLDR